LVLISCRLWSGLEIINRHKWLFMNRSSYRFAEQLNLYETNYACNHFRLSHSSLKERFDKICINTTRGNAHVTSKIQFNTMLNYKQY
jgi:hypothetical protein